MLISKNLLMILKQIQMATSKINYGAKFGKTGFPQPKLKTKKIEYPAGPRSVEKDTIVELTELQKDFREAAKKEEQMKADNTNSEFFSVLVFKTQEQRDKFYTLLNIKSDDMQYIDGQKLIAAMELNIEKVNLKNPGKFKCNVDIANLALQ